MSSFYRCDLVAVSDILSSDGERNLRATTTYPHSRLCITREGFDDCLRKRIATSVRPNKAIRSRCRRVYSTTQVHERNTHGDIQPPGCCCKGEA